MIATLFRDFVTWLNTNAGILGIIVAILLAVVPAIWTFISYLRLKNRELQFERFKIYHQLIRDLVQAEAKGVAIMLDRQIAVVFELRNFRDYFELTLRTLEGLKRQWSTEHGEHQRLHEEMDLTIEFIQKKLKITQPED